MSLGDYTRVVRTFLEAFKMSTPGAGISASELSTDELDQANVDDTELSRLHTDLQVRCFSSVLPLSILKLVVRNTTKSSTRLA
jgi:hypothetical protein